MKKLVITFLMIAMVLNLCGCVKKGLTMNVSVYYFGDGLEGTGKIDGSREYVIEDVGIGNLIFEYPEGELSKELKEGYSEYHWFIKLERIDEDSVTITADTGDAGTRSYEHFTGNEFVLYSPSYAPGDLHYVYTITFTE